MSPARVTTVSLSSLRPQCRHAPEGAPRGDGRRLVRRRRPLDPDGDLQEHVRHRHTSLPVRRADVPPEIRLVDVRRLQARPALLRGPREGRHHGLREEQRVGPARVPGEEEHQVLPVLRGAVPGPDVYVEAEAYRRLL